MISISRPSGALLVKADPVLGGKEGGGKYIYRRLKQNGEAQVSSFVRSEWFIAIRESRDFLPHREDSYLFVLLNGAICTRNALAIIVVANFLVSPSQASRLITNYGAKHSAASVS